MILARPLQIERVLASCFLATEAVVFEDFVKRHLLGGRQLFGVEFGEVDLRLASNLFVLLIALRAKRQSRLEPTQFPESPTDRSL